MKLATVLFSAGQVNHGMLRLDEALTTYRGLLEKPRSETFIEDYLEGINLLNSWVMIINGTNDLELFRMIASTCERQKEKPSQPRAGRWLFGYVLAGSLTGLGELKGDEASLQLAVTELEAIRAESSFEGAPGYWAATQWALGKALGSMAEMRRDAAQLSDAVAAYRQAQRILKPELSTSESLTLQASLAAALSTSGWLEKNVASLTEAIATLEAIEPDLNKLGWPRRAMMNHFQRGLAWMRLGQLKQDSVSIRKAVEAFEQALREVPRAHLPIDWARIQNRLAEATLALAEQQRTTLSIAFLNDRIEPLRAALQVFRNTGSDYYAADTERHLARMTWILNERRAASAAEHDSAVGRGDRTPP
jgi:tetratricopeptide (TPR) repeat protein